MWPGAKMSLMLVVIWCGCGEPDGYLMACENASDSCPSDLVCVEKVNFNQVAPPPTPAFVCTKPCERDAQCFRDGPCEVDGYCASVMALGQ